MQSFVISLQTIPLLLFVALLGMATTYAAITLFDKHLNPELCQRDGKRQPRCWDGGGCHHFLGFYLVAQAGA